LGSAHVSGAADDSAIYTLYTDFSVFGPGANERVYVATFDAGPAEAERMGGNISTPAEYNRHFCEYMVQAIMDRSDHPRRMWCEAGRYRR
jgi:hypothetical protein